MAKIGIGLDIGTSSVKIVEIEYSKTAFRVNRLGIALYQREYSMAE